MSDVQTETPAQKPKRKYRRRRRSKVSFLKGARRVVDAPVASGEFDGMTATACCDACNIDRCIITGIALCGHPKKGGLQPMLMTKPDILSRYERAKKSLAHLKVDAS